MRFRDYLRSCIWEWILCVLISGSLSLIMFHGFYIAERWQNNYLCVAGVTGIITAVCLLGAYNKRSAKIVAACGITIAAIGLVIVQRMEPVHGLLRDREENPGIYFLILILTALIIFFMSRTRTGSGFMFVAGSMTAASVQFLYETAEIRWLILLLCSAGMMYIYKNYQKNVRENSAAKADFGKVFLTSAVVCMLVISIACGIFYGVVKPLEPSVHELKLITKYMSLEVLEKTGIADTHILNDTDETTDNVDDDEKDSSKKGDDDAQKDGDKIKQKDKNDKDKTDNPAKLNDLLNKFFYAVRYLASKVSPILIIPILILLVIAAVVTKLMLRKRWLKKLMKKEKREQITGFYSFYIKRFRKLKIHKNPEETPYEFAERSAAYLQDFDTENISFSDLTDIFVKARYSREPIEEAEYQRYLMFHHMFYRNCRKHIGAFKYILKFFIL